MGRQGIVKEKYFLKFHVSLIVFSIPPIFIYFTIIKSVKLKRDLIFQEGKTRGWYGFCKTSRYGKQLYTSLYIHMKVELKKN